MLCEGSFLWSHLCRDRLSAFYRARNLHGDHRCRLRTWIQIPWTCHLWGVQTGKVGSCISFLWLSYQITTSLVA